MDTLSIGRRFTDAHGFVKPNDERGLKLMDHAAMDLMREYKDVVLAFGESDEYSFLLRRTTSLYNRREAKILTTLTSHFTAAYIFHWAEYFTETPLQYPPTFDGRLVLYPGSTEVRDYFAWRQADTHINNLYNTAFWALVQQGGQTTTEAHTTLRGTVSSQKHEILFLRFGVNYNELPALFRKGSVLVREEPDTVSEPVVEETETTRVTGENEGDVPAQSLRAAKKKSKPIVRLYHDDIIGATFWDKRPNILSE